MSPTYRANILDHPDDRWGNLSLNSQAKLRGAWGRIAISYVRQRRRKGLGRCSAVQGAGVGVGKVNVGGGRLVCKGWILCSVVNVVALNTFKEHSKTASDYCRFLSGETAGKAYSRLPSVVVVLYHSTRKSGD